MKLSEATEPTARNCRIGNSRFKRTSTITERGELNLPVFLLGEMFLNNKQYLVDTNVIIHYPSLFLNIENLHIHLKTVEELDRLKESENGELAYRARKGAKGN